MKTKTLLTIVFIFQLLLVLLIITNAVFTQIERAAMAIPLVFTTALTIAAHHDCGDQ